jgi:hypothetical protein
VRVDQLAGKSLFLTTPVYNLNCLSPYVNGLLALSSLCRAYEVPLSINFMHDSLVTRARNRQADLFLSSTFTHQMLIDGDIEFQAADVLKLLTLDEEFIAAPYPKKQINWSRAKKAIVLNREIDVDMLDKLCGDFVVNIVGKTEDRVTQIKLDTLNEVTDAGTGFMLLNRSVYTKMIDAGKVKSYAPMSDEPSFYGPEIYDFFRADIDPETKHYLSEDYYFSRLWKSMGGKVWMAPWVNLVHWGIYSYRGSLSAVAESGVAQAEIEERLAEVAK